MAVSMSGFRKLFPRHLTANVVGMIHLMGNPGTPKCNHSVKQILKQAEREASIYKEAGVDGVIVENMHDVPYLLGSEMGPEIVAAMTAACLRVRSVFNTGPVGVQILAGANKEAMAVALAADLDFIRAECFVYSHIADEGLMNACAGPLLRYRKHIGADHIQVYTDIKKKHSAHVLTSDVDIQATAHAAEYFLSDGVILTGSSTGVPANTQELKAVQDSVNIPVLIGSGLTKDNWTEYRSANALIVGSYFKQGGQWNNPIDEKVLSDFMDTVKSGRSTES